MSLPIRMHRPGTRGRRSSVARTVAWLAGAAAVSVLAACGGSSGTTSSSSGSGGSAASPTPGTTVLAGASCQSSSEKRWVTMSCGCRFQRTSRSTSSRSRPGTACATISRSRSAAG